MTKGASVLRALFEFFLADDALPWGLQLFWKCLTLGLGALLIYAAGQTPGAVAALVYALGAFWLVFGLLTKLGNGC